MANEPGAAVLAIFDQLIDRVKQARPVRSDGKPLGGGVVYSMLTLGMPVDPDDYRKPWSPVGGAVAQGQTPPAAGAAGTPATPAGASAAPAADPKYARALEAAYKTAVLSNTLLQVTTDGSYLEYPTGRHLDSAYEGIISAMQPMPMPPISPEIQKQIDDAKKVLYDLDPDDGSISGKSKLYKKYEKNALDYALAKANYATAMADAKRDPAKAETWPMTSATYQNAVDDAYDTLKTEGAEKVERALDIIGSIGVSLQDHMIKKARQLFDVYNLGLAGVPAPIPYSFVNPSGWCDPEDDDDGWQSLEVTSNTVKQYATSNASSQSQFSWMKKSSSTSGGGGVTFGFVALGGSGGKSSAHSDSQDSSSSQSSNTFSNKTSNLHISLQYMLASIERPWLVSDLFYMRNWYMPGQKMNAVSDGTEANQANVSDINKLPLLPMIPQQMLLIRNVKITADWSNEDRKALTSAYSGDRSNTDSSSWNASGSAGVSLGFVNFGGTAGHSESKSEGKGSHWAANSGSVNLDTSFDQQTLTVKGTQVVAFLSDIVPACPPLDDPALA